MRATRSVREILITVAPLALAVFVFALSFGVLAIAAGIPGWAAVLMSALVFAGSAQFAALGVITAGGSVLTAVLAGGLLNLRYIATGIAVPRSLAYGWLVSPGPGAGPGRPLFRHARDRAISSQHPGGHHAADDRARARIAGGAGLDPADRTEWDPPSRREGTRGHPGRSAVGAAAPPDRLRRCGRPAGRATSRGLSPLGGAGGYPLRLTARSSSALDIFDRPGMRFSRASLRS